MAADAALPQRPEQIPERAIAQEIETLVGDLEPHGRRVLTAHPTGAASFPLTPLSVEVGVLRNVALPRHLLDDLPNQLLEPRATVGLIGVGRVAKQSLDHIIGQQIAVQERVDDRVMEGLE